jgi:hypothetical protein
MRASDICIGLIASILYCRYILPRSCNEKPTIQFSVYPIIYQGMVIIPVYSKACHIHHWIIYSILACFVDGWLYVFCVVLTLQGLSYKDAFTIVVENPYNVQT